jgi:hypothetical protein
MSISTVNTDTTFDRIPQTDRDAIRGREKADLSQPQGKARTKPPRARRFLFTGTSGPLAAIAPSPPQALDAHYESDQGAVSEYVKNAIRAMWDAHIDPERFSASWKDMGPILKILIAQAYSGSAGNAAEYYRNLHVVHGLDYPVVRPAGFNPQHLNRMTGSVANGTFYHHLNTKGDEPGTASGVARNTLSGAGARFALNGARNTVTAAVARDPEATGWERMLSPGACSYCAAQAAKGPFKPGNTSFRAHDYCSCLAKPVLRGVSDSPNAELHDQWNRITETFTGKEARAAWDQYWREHGDKDASA